VPADGVQARVAAQGGVAGGAARFDGRLDAFAVGMVPGVEQLGRHRRAQLAVRQGERVRFAGVTRASLGGSSTIAPSRAKNAGTS